MGKTAFLAISSFSTSFIVKNRVLEMLLRCPFSVFFRRITKKLVSAKIRVFCYMGFISAEPGLFSLFL